MEWKHLEQTTNICETTSSGKKIMHVILSISMLKFSSISDLSAVSIN